MIQRGGQVVLKMLANVQQTTIKPIIEAGVAKGGLIHTDKYDIYARLPAWGYEHKTVCHGRGEYARDEDGVGFHEIHVNTIEGFWSLPRSWLRPHRGIAQEKPPLYLAFCTRRRNNLPGSGGFVRSRRGVKPVHFWVEPFRMLIEEGARDVCRGDLRSGPAVCFR